MENPAYIKQVSTVKNERTELQGTRLLRLGEGSMGGGRGRHVWWIGVWYEVWCGVVLGVEKKDLFTVAPL
jgi:hypothetical protein